MGKQTLQPSTVMTMRERRELAKLQKKDQERRRKEKRDRLNASEFGAATTDAALGRSSTRKSAVRVEKKSLKPTSTYTADTVKIAKEKAKPKKEGDPRYRPGKGGVGDARYRPGAGSVASQLAQSGMKVTKKPSTSNANASTSTTKKKDTPSVRTTSNTSKSSYDEVKKQKRKGKSSYDEVKPQKKTTKKGPGVGKQDKEDKRKNFKSTPVKNAALPAGAKPFKGGYNSKTHKLQNIRGKTYVVPKPKAKKK